MTTHTTIAVRRHTLNTVSVTALGSALMLVAGNGTAYAQAAPKAPAAESADIVVTGFRQSVENSIKIKKLSTGIVESVTAEDVGKLPDTSITESLSRLAGVTSQRLAGRADILSVRGFGPDFTVALFNHREIATTGDDRGFQYDQIPSELVNRGDVIKTPSARQIGQGLAGTIDLQTIDPLQQAHRILSISARGEANAYAKENPDVTNKGYRGSIIYVDKFADNTIGISLGGSILSTPQQNKQIWTWGFPTDGSGNNLLGGGRWFATSNLETRESGFGRIEYKPNNKFEMSVDVFASHFKTKEQQRGLELPLIWGSGTTVSTVANGIATQEVTSNNYAVQRNNYNGRNANTLAIGWNTKYALSDTLKLNVDASYSRAARHDFNLETYSGNGYNQSGTPDTDTVVLQPNYTYTLSTTQNYNDPKLLLTDPKGWGGNNATGAVVQAGFLNAPDFVDEIKALRADLVGDLNSSFFKSWEIGASYSKRSKTAGFKGYFLRPSANQAITSLPIPANVILGGVTPFNYVSGQTLAYDPLAVYNLLTPIQDIRPAEALTRDYVVDEKVLSGYVQANINGTLGALPVKGNIGVQVVNTDQFSSGNSASIVNNALVTLATNGGAKYTYALPSANLQIEVAHNSFLRIAASRSLSRARQEDLRSTNSFSGSTTPAGQLPSGNPYYITGNGGNPALRPYISDNVDLSFEKYFAHGAGLFQVTGFFKSLSGYVDPNNSVQVDFSPVKTSIYSPAGLAIVGNNLIGVVTAPANTGRGSVLGAEANLSLPFSALSKSLDGLGVLFNGAYTDSSVKFGNGGAITIPGLSDVVYAATLFYEKNGFQVRGSYNYRSKFLGETSTVTQAASLSTIAPSRIFDAQIGYEFKHGPAKGLSVILQGKNLTNAPFISYYKNDPRLIEHYETYGATYLLGVTYKF